MSFFLHILYNQPEYSLILTGGTQNELKIAAVTQSRVQLDFTCSCLGYIFTIMQVCCFC